MHNQTKSSRNRGSVLRPVLAALLMLGGVALLARAGSPTSSGSTQVKQAAATIPGVPRFQNYQAPPGIADDVGEPSIGCNWKSETTNRKLPDGSAMLLSYLRYLAPNGTAIHEKGLTPEVPVDEPDVEFGAVAPTTDPTLQRAIEYFAQKKAA